MPRKLDKMPRASIELEKLLKEEWIHGAMADSFDEALASVIRCEICHRKDNLVYSSKWQATICLDCVMEAHP